VVQQTLAEKQLPVLRLRSPQAATSAQDDSSNDDVVGSRRFDRDKEHFI